MQCKAKSKQSGQQCKKSAVPGFEVCEIHGGKSLRGADHPNFKTGIYAKDTPHKFHEKAQRFLDADPFDLIPEIALMRTLLADYLSRFEISPLDEHAIYTMSNLISEISKLAERLTRIKNETAMTGAEIALLETRITGTIVKYIDDPAKREAFIREIFGINGDSDIITVNAASVTHSPRLRSSG
jgi:hypothetical protein